MSERIHNQSMFLDLPVVVSTLWGGTPGGSEDRWWYCTPFAVGRRECVGVYPALDVLYDHLCDVGELWDHLYLELVRALLKEGPTIAAEHGGLNAENLRVATIHYVVDWTPVLGTDRAPEFSPYARIAGRARTSTTVRFHDPDRYSVDLAPGDAWQAWVLGVPGHERLRVERKGGVR